MKKIFVSIILVVFVNCAILAVILPSAYVTPILMYHNIDERRDILSVPPEHFERQMRFLKGRRYKVIYLSQLIDLIVKDEKIARNTVVITFDDGMENNFTNAYPILKKYAIPATMFVIPGHCGRQDYLSKEQVSELSENGIEIGSHTLNDVWLPSRDDKQIIEEVLGSKIALERITGKDINLISYPLGGFDQRVRLAVMRAGYKAGCATNPGRFSANNDIYALKRLKVSGKNSGNIVSFWFKTTGYATWFKEHKQKGVRRFFHKKAPDPFLPKELRC